ncbi:MAG: hypothetical protein IJA20_02685 [Methanocorpusculum sp.]|nr:hypothetical protein [Methanocorpusculum sp.]
MFKPSFESTKWVMDEKGYAFFENGDYNVNIIGVRKNTIVTNTFDDVLLMVYKVNGKFVVHYFPFTTDPGRGPMKAPPAKGRAVLKPGQYRGAYKLGLHRGKEEALVQVKPVTVFRDRNGDMTMDYNNPDTGLFGINIHWSSKTGTSKLVDNWSEGCQVGTGVEERNAFLSILRESKARYGNSFTYTLLEERDWE